MKAVGFAGTLPQVKAWVKRHETRTTTARLIDLGRGRWQAVFDLTPKPTIGSKRKGGDK